ncbi:MAG: VapC toxin family PIN domain ribonuclease [Chloroflexi bacterium]|nr:VapC toxin family PIN domain ribonuclease [Chloroflexota bacterium]
MTVLIDTSFLVAVAFRKDNNHEAAKAALRELGELRLIPVVVLPEMFYMLATRADYAAAATMFNRIRTGAFQIESLTKSDMARMEEIMGQYRDNRFDFVDTVIMAMAERLNIEDIYTFDRRDFSAFRPQHCSYLRLLP